MQERFNPEKFREQTREEQNELLVQLHSCVSKTNAENAFVSFAVFLITRWVAERLEKGSASSRPALVEFAAFHLYPHFGNTNKRSAPDIASLIALIEKLKEGRTFEHIASAGRGLDAKLAENRRAGRWILLRNSSSPVATSRGCASKAPPPPRSGTP
jgi:hypothetical protein